MVLLVLLVLVVVVVFLLYIVEVTVLVEATGGRSSVTEVEGAVSGALEDKAPPGVVTAGRSVSEVRVADGERAEDALTTEVFTGDGETVGEGEETLGTKTDS